MARENRKSKRRDANYTVWLRYGSDPVLVPCVMIDVSEGGARLEIAGNADLPDRFILQLSEFGRAHRKCQVAWRFDKQIGVRFVT